MRIPEPRRSKSGLTRTARRGVFPSFSARASARSASPSDSRFTVTPTEMAASSSSLRLPGPAKLIRSGDTPACKAKRSEEHTSELQSLMRKSYAVLCLKKKNTIKTITTTPYTKKHTTNTEQPITNKTTNHISQNKHNITNHNTPVTILK